MTDWLQRWWFMFFLGWKTVVQSRSLYGRHVSTSFIRFSGPWWSRLVAKHSSLWLFVLLAFVWSCWISWLLSAWIDCFGSLHLVQVAVCFGQMFNLGIEREETAKSKDGQQKGTLAHVKRRVAMGWNLSKNIDIHVYLLQFQPSRLASPRGCLEACLEACQAHPEDCLFLSKFAWSRTRVATEDANLCLLWRDMETDMSSRLQSLCSWPSSQDALTYALREFFRSWKNSLISSVVDRAQLWAGWFLCCGLHQGKCRCESPSWPDQRPFPANAVKLWATAGAHRGR